MMTWFFLKISLMTITQHALLYNFHTSDLIFEEIFFLKFLSMQPLVWGFASHESPNRKWDPQSAYPLRGSHLRFGDSRDMNPQTANGIPKPHIHFGDPICGLGICETWIPKPQMGSPNRISTLGIPLAVWGLFSHEPLALREFFQFGNTRVEPQMVPLAVMGSH